MAWIGLVNMFPFKMQRFGVSWGGSVKEWYWVSFYRLVPGYRFLGPDMVWYDGPNYRFGFWWFALFWVLPWGWANPDWDKLKAPWVHDWAWLNKDGTTKTEAEMVEIRKKKDAT